MAASAAVVADMRFKSDGTVHSLLPGAEQLNDRAEVFAILLALQLSKQCTIYSDCQYAVDAANIREYHRSKGTCAPLMKHMDLWEVFDLLMAGRPEGTVTFIKVKAHLDLKSHLPHFLDICHHYNHLADSAAKHAVRNAASFSYNQLRVMNANQIELRGVVMQNYSFLIQCAQFEFAKKAEARASPRFELSVLDVPGNCFLRLAIVDDDDALPRCPYSRHFACALLAWAKGLQWACSRPHADTSMTELLVNFIFSAGLRPPVNIDKFRAGKRPAYSMRNSCPCDLPLEAFAFAEVLRTFQGALKWFRKYMRVDLLPGEFVANCRSLYVLGCSCPTKGVSYQVKHACEPDPRAHLQDLCMRRSAGSGGVTIKGELLECTQECSLLADYARELFQGAGLCEPLAAEWFAEESWVKALPCYALRRRRRRVQLQRAHAE